MGAPCIVRAEARGQRQSTACAVLLFGGCAIGAIPLLVLFLGRLRLPLFSSSRRRWGLLVKRTLGTSVPTFFLLIISLLEFDYDYLGFSGFVDYAYLDGWAGGGEGGRTEELVFCVDYHYAVAFYREWAYDGVDCVHVGFVALGVDHQAV